MFTRPVSLKPALVAAMAVAASSLAAACASANPQPTYAQEMSRLEADCTARGGQLLPTSRPLTGRPQTDNVCRIVGGPSERLRSAG